MTDDRLGRPDGDAPLSRSGKRIFASRRRLLAALAAGSGGIAVTSAATRSSFTDVEQLGASVDAGVLDALVEWEIVDGPGAGSGGRSDGTVEIPIEYDGNDRSGAVVFGVDHAQIEGNNPADLWMTGDCPGSLGTIGEVAEFTLSYADCDSGSPGPELASGSMREVLDRLAEGIPLDADPSTGERECLDPGERLCLRLDWSIEGYVGDESVTPTIEVIARQCRHVDRSIPPFEPGDGCDPGDACPCCLPIGKLELEAGGPGGIGENRISPGTYEFTEGTTDHRIRVTDTVEKDDGETVAVAFELVDEHGDPGPALCRVEIAGGPGSGPGPGVETYEPPSGGPYGNTTDSLTFDEDGLLYARRRSGTGDDPNDHHGISHVTVAICAADGRCD